MGGGISLDQLVTQTERDFLQRYHSSPRWVVAAPGRVNLIGEHTDYNDGFVLPMAIERWTVIAAKPSQEKRGLLHSSAIGSTATIELQKPVSKAAPDWANYVRGVVAGFQRLDLELSGFDGVMDSTVPLGSGLSSSAALEVASATLLEAVTGHRLDPVQKALLCQRAEHEFAGVPCGIMDQFTSALARKDHLLLLDCRSHKVELVPMTDPSIAVLIVNTNVRHELASGEYGQRRAQCETAARILGVPALRDATLTQLTAAQDRLDPVAMRRARHVITENERTVAAAKAISRGEWARVGELMYASHASLRDDYEVSCSELDCVVDSAKAIGPSGGVVGCRMTGGGFGGCAVALVEAPKVDAIMQTLARAYQQGTGRQATMFVSRPAGGAAVLRQ